MSDMAEEDGLEQRMARIFGPPHAPAAQHESIEPSSGFSAAVMERVRAEAAGASALGPIAFPWRRAVPGICMALLAASVAVVLVIASAVGVTHLISHTLVSASAHAAAPPPAWAQTASQTAAQLHLGGLLIALAAAFVPLLLSRGLASRDRGV